MNLHHINKGIKAFLFFVAIILIGLLTLLLSKRKDNAMSSVASSPELFNHPIYSNYDFNQNDSLINIGIQPMYHPTGIIFEVIKRDNILNKAIAASGKRIKYYPFLKGADVNFFLQQDLLIGGVGGDMPTLTAASTFDVVIPMIIQNGNASIVSREPMLTNDLKGKRIAYPEGSVSHYFILKLLHSGGVAENMVHLISMDVSSMAKALHNKEIDLFSAWEPNVASALKQYPNFFITYQRITTGFLYFSEAFVQQNSEIVNHILAAVIRSISWMKSDRENLLLACEWNRIEREDFTGEKSILSEQEIANLALKDILRYYSKYSMVIKAEDIMTNSSLHREYEFLAALNKENENLNWEKVAKSFDNNLIMEIMKHPKEFQINEYDYTK